MNHSIASPEYFDLFKRFLITKGWKNVPFPNERVMLFEGRPDDLGNPIRIYLPLGGSSQYIQQEIERAIRGLAALEHCSEKEMAEQVLAYKNDALRSRFILPSNPFTLSLSYLKQLTLYLSSLFHLSNETEMQTEPDLGQAKSWKRIEDRCQFGQTFVGSFGISLLMPIEVQPGAGRAPLERRVMERIARACLTVQSAVQTGDERLLTPAQGFDPGMCSVMQQLAKMLKGSQMEFSFSWSPECKVSADLEKIEPILLSADEMQPVLKRALKVTRQPAKIEEISVSGHITQLKHTEENGAVFVDSSSGLIRLSLTAPEYRLACDAHRDGKRVSVRGLLKGGHLKNHTDFHIL